MKPKTFKGVKRASKRSVLSVAIGNIAVKINEKLTVFVKQGTDIEKIKAKYSKHVYDYANYMGSPLKA